MSDIFTRQMLGLSELIHHTGIDSGNYPPYNIVISGDDQFVLELALAGFTRESIKISVERNVLIITGTHPRSEESGVTYQHRGISTRGFTRRFGLAQFYEVSGAEFKDGMLTVKLVRNVPEDQKPREIKIT